MTKDERLLLELYRAAEGSPKKRINPHHVAKTLRYKDNLIKNILRGLGQANLIKIYSPEEISLTERGCSVAQSLLT